MDTDWRFIPPVYQMMDRALANQSPDTRIVSHHKRHGDCVGALLPRMGLEATGFPLGALSEFSAFGTVAKVQCTSMWGATMLMLVGHGLFKAVNRVFPYLGRGCIVALATVSILDSCHRTISLNSLVSGTLRHSLDRDCKPRP